MTTEMIKYLLMSDYELKKYSGKRLPDDYRKLIMRNLASLWD